MNNSLTLSLLTCLLGLPLLAAPDPVAPYGWGKPAAIQTETYQVPWAVKSSVLSTAQAPTSEAASLDAPAPEIGRTPTPTQQLGLEALVMGWKTAPHKKFRDDAVKAFGESWVAQYESRYYYPERCAGIKMLMELFAEPGDDEYDAAHRYRKAHRLHGMGESEIWEHASKTLREGREARHQRLQDISSSLQTLSNAVLRRLWGEPTEDELTELFRTRNEALEGVLGEDGQFHLSTDTVVPGKKVELVINPKLSVWQQQLLHLDEDAARKLCEAQPLFARLKAGNAPHDTDATPEALCGLLFATGEYAIQRVDGKEITQWEHHLRGIRERIKNSPLGGEMKELLRRAHLDYQVALTEKEKAWKQAKREKAEAFWQAVLRGGVILLLALAALTALFFIGRRARYWALEQWVTALAVILLAVDLMKRDGMYLGKGFPILVQLGLTAAGAWMTYAAARAKRHPLFILAPAIIALLYQPLFDLKFRNDTWAMIDLGTIVVLIVCAWRRRAKEAPLSAPDVAEPEIADAGVEDSPAEHAAAAAPASIVSKPASLACKQSPVTPVQASKPTPKVQIRPSVSPNTVAFLPKQEPAPSRTQQAEKPQDAKKATSVRAGWWAIGIAIWLASAAMYVFIGLLAEEYIQVWEEMFHSCSAVLQAFAKGAWVAACFSLARAVWRK